MTYMYYNNNPNYIQSLNYIFYLIFIVPINFAPHTYFYLI